MAIQPGTWRYNQGYWTDLIGNRSTCLLRIHVYIYIFISLRICKAPDMNTNPLFAIVITLTYHYIICVYMFFLITYIHGSHMIHTMRLPFSTTSSIHGASHEVLIWRPRRSQWFPTWTPSPTPIPTPSGWDRGGCDIVMVVTPMGAQSCPWMACDSNGLMGQQRWARFERLIMMANSDT